MKRLPPIGRAAHLAKMGREQDALALLEPFCELPDPRLHLLRGQWLRAIGDTTGSIAALRTVAEIEPRLGAAWLGLADLKTVPFEDEDLLAMATALADPAITTRDRYLIHFALGRACEERGRLADAFEHYATANRLQRENGPADPFDVAQMVERQKAVLTRTFFEERRDCGIPSAAPIFIIGMHRSGSTLLEQILSSHPAIEGTDELPYVGLIANALRKEGQSPFFVDPLATLDPPRFADLAEDYLRNSARHRHSGRPLFIDKRPGNWLAVGLIHLMLPNARIIDVRRNPLDCCLANFRQFFEVGDMLRDLGDLGRFYAEYVSLMDHFGESLPGRVMRVDYERLVSDTEAEVRRLLAYLGLDYDPACMRAHDNRRSVRTPSAQQVRRPISSGSIGRWRAFDPWLGPLKEALGPALVEDAVRRS